MRHLVRTALILAMVSVLTLVSVGTALAQPSSSELEVKGVISAIDKTATPPKLSVSQPLAKHHSFVGTIESMTSTSFVVTTKKQGFVGTIKSMTSASFVVTTKKQGDVTINVNAETKYKAPGVKNAALTNFKAGDRVAVLAVESAGGNLALRVNLIPGKPISVQRVGTVEAYVAGTSITLKDKKGNLSIFVVTSDTKIQLKKGATEVKVGERAHVLAKRDPASDQFTAKAILVFGSKGSPKLKKSEKSEKPEKPEKGK